MPPMTYPPRRVRRRLRRTAGLVGILLAAGALASCGVLPTDRDPAPTRPTTGTELLPEGTDRVDLEVGETAQVSLGEGSQGVGDAWGLAEQNDDGVADTGGIATAEVVLGDDVVGSSGGDGGEEKPGASMTYAVELTGTAPGTTTVRVLYCTRTKTFTEECDQSNGTKEPPVEPVEITVTVG